jgi:hypothetical protein
MGAKTLRPKRTATSTGPCIYSSVSDSLKRGLPGWGGRIRTSAWGNQNPLPYHLATPQSCLESGGTGLAADSFWQRRSIEGVEPFQPARAPFWVESNAGDDPRIMRQFGPACRVVLTRKWPLWLAPGTLFQPSES